MVSFSGTTFPHRTCYSHLLLANTLQVGPLVTTENTADHRFCAEFMATTVPCTKIRERTWNLWNHKTYIYAIWCDPIKFTMENINNHSFYVVIFWVLCKWSLIAHHKLFYSDHISCSAQLPTFPGCLKETQKSKVFLQWYYSEKITTFDENNVDLKHEYVKQKPLKWKCTIYT